MPTIPRTFAELRATSGRSQVELGTVSEPVREALVNAVIQRDYLLAQSSTRCRSALGSQR
ncbi:MAG: hypothetical protein ACRDQ4_13875 [Pseudonocardiaceae bacterium]